MSATEIDPLGFMKRFFQCLGCTYFLYFPMTWMGCFTFSKIAFSLHVLFAMFVAWASKKPTL